MIEHLPIYISVVFALTTIITIAYAWLYMAQASACASNLEASASSNMLKDPLTPIGVKPYKLLICKINE